MAESHLVSGLKNLRGEKLGRLREIREEVERLEAEAAKVEALVAHVDGVLKDQAPELDLEAIKPVRSRRTREANEDDGSKHKLPVTQHVLRVLRQERQPLSMDEIVECLAVQRPGADRKALKASVYQGVYKFVKDGLVARQQLNDGRKVYVIDRTGSLAA